MRIEINKQLILESVGKAAGALGLVGALTHTNEIKKFIKGSSEVDDAIKSGASAITHGVIGESTTGSEVFEEVKMPNNSVLNKLKNIDRTPARIGDPSNVTDAIKTTQKEVLMKNTAKTLRPDRRETTRS